jgi:protein-disulfide isomerase
MAKQQRTGPARGRAAKAAVVARHDRRVNWGLLVTAAIIVGLLAAIGIAVFRAAGDEPAGSARALVPPANTVASGAIPVGEPSAPTTVEIYLDFMCPACGQFEQTNGEELDRLIRSGSVRVELRPMSFLDRTSRGTKYSTRAANAVATVTDRDPRHVWAFVRALYENQPRENTPGLGDERIAELAREAGVDGGAVDAFDDLRFEPWVADVTEAAFASGVRGTPTVKINGVLYDGDLFRVGPLTQAIEAAAGSGS